MNPIRVIALNRKASFLYKIKDTWVAGLVLLGPEVRCLRMGRASIAESHVRIDRKGKAWIYNLDIPILHYGHYAKHYEPRAPRPLLLKKSEIKKMRSLSEKEGATLIPLKLFFNERGYAKIEVALAEGKKKHEKRDDLHKKDWQRQKERLLKRQR